MGVVLRFSVGHGRRLGIFAGSWSLKAAEAICVAPLPTAIPFTGASEPRPLVATAGQCAQDASGGTALATEDPVLDRLAALVDQSLVERIEAAEGEHASSC